MPAAPDSGFLAAIIVAGGVTAVVAIAMMLVSQYRASVLTAARGALAITLGVGVLALAGLGVVALSPVSAQAITTVSSVTSGVTSATTVDVQLPTR